MIFDALTYTIATVVFILTFTILLLARSKK